MWIKEFELTWNTGFESSVVQYDPSEINARLIIEYETWLISYLQIWTNLHAGGNSGSHCRRGIGGTANKRKETSLQWFLIIQKQILWHSKRTVRANNS